MLGFSIAAVLVFAAVCVVMVVARGDTAQGIPPPHPNSQWLKDPTGRHQYRLWDGQQWSAHVSDGGRAGYDPLTTGPPGQPPVQPPVQPHDPGPRWGPPRP